MKTGPHLFCWLLGIALATSVILPSSGYGNPNTDMPVRMAIRIDGGGAAPSVATAVDSLLSRTALRLQVIPSLGSPAESIAAVSGWPQDTVRLRMARILCNLNSHVCCAQPPRLLATTWSGDLGKKVIDCRALRKIRDRNQAAALTWNEAQNYCSSEAGIEQSERACTFIWWNSRHRANSKVLHTSCDQLLRNDELCVPNLEVTEVLESTDVLADSVEESLQAARHLTSCENPKISAQYNNNKESLCDRYANLRTLNLINAGSITKLLKTGRKDPATGKVPVQIPTRAFVLEFSTTAKISKFLMSPSQRTKLQFEIAARRNASPLNANSNAPNLATAEFRSAALYVISTKSPAKGKVQAALPSTEGSTYIKDAAKIMGWGEIAERLIKTAKVANSMPAILLYEPVGIQRIPSFLSGRVSQQAITDYAKNPTISGKRTDCSKFTANSIAAGSLDDEELAHAERVAGVLVGSAQKVNSDYGVLAKLTNQLVWIGYEEDPTITTFQRLGLTMQFLEKCQGAYTPPLGLVMNISSIVPTSAAPQIFAFMKKRKRSFFTLAAGNILKIREAFPQLIRADLTDMRLDGCPQQPACYATQTENAISVASLNSKGSTLAAFSVGGPAIEVAAVGYLKSLDGTGASYNGTSYSAPIVAAQAGLLIGKFYPTLRDEVGSEVMTPSAQDIKNRILATVDFARSFKVRFGRINFDRSLQIGRDQISLLSPDGKCAAATRMPELSEKPINISDLELKSYVDYEKGFAKWENSPLTVEGSRVLRMARSCDDPGYHIVYIDSKGAARHLLVKEFTNPTNVVIEYKRERKLSEIFDFTRCMLLSGRPICG